MLSAYVRAGRRPLLADPSLPAVSWHGLCDGASAGIVPPRRHSPSASLGCVAGLVRVLFDMLMWITEPRGQPPWGAGRRTEEDNNDNNDNNDNRALRATLTDPPQGETRHRPPQTSSTSPTPTPGGAASEPPPAPDYAERWSPPSASRACTVPPSGPHANLALHRQ